MEQDKALLARVNQLRGKYAARDAVAQQVRWVKNGDFDKVAPGIFNESYPRSITANLIDVYSKHAAAALSPLPSIRCRAASMGASDRAKKRADKRTQIVNHYFEYSRVQEQMQSGADNFYSYGLIVAQVAPDFNVKLPSIRVLGGLGFYPVWDWRGITVELAHVFRKNVDDIIALYPEVGSVLDKHRQRATTIEIIHHDDGKMITLLAPELDGLVLHRQPNPVGMCLFQATMAPSDDGQIKGAFDQLIWPQIARNELQLLTLQAVSDAVESPIAAPLDVNEVSLGPKTLIKTNNPQSVRKVDMGVPHESFAAIAHFKDELQAGAITPQALGGSIDASVVTGQGVQQLMAGYSQQIAHRQESLKGFFERLAELCFRLDEALWNNTERTISGYRNGNEYNVKYIPANDIAGDYHVDVNYGTATGLDPNRHLVFLLQLLGAGLYSKDTVLQELPGQINAADEVAKIQVEQGREAIMSAVTGLSQSIPGMVAQGQDPSEMVAKVVQFVNELERGKPLEEIASKVWPVAKPEPPQLSGMMPGAEGMPDDADLGMGEPEAPLMQPGAGAPSPVGGGRAPLQAFYSGLTSAGTPNLGAYVTRMNAAR